MTFDATTRAPTMLDPDVPVLRYAILENGVAQCFINIKEGDQETIDLLKAVPASDTRVQHGCQYDAAAGDFVLPEERAEVTEDQPEEAK